MSRRETHHEDRSMVTTALSVVFLVALFNGFAQWHSIQGLVNKSLAVLIYVTIFIDTLSFRASSGGYTIRSYILDVCALFIYTNIFDQLKSANSAIVTYQLSFWLYLMALGFVFAAWDWHFISTGLMQWPQPKTLRKWAIYNIVAALMCLVTYGALYWLDQNPFSVSNPVNLSTLLIIPAFLSWFALIFIWVINISPSSFRTESSK